MEAGAAARGAGAARGRGPKGAGGGPAAGGGRPALRPLNGPRPPAPAGGARPGSGGLRAGAPVWVAGEGGGGWRAGEFVRLSGGGAAVVRLEGGESEAAVWLPGNPHLLEAAPDLTRLSYLNEPCLLHNLKARFEAGLIYTQAGPLLIAVNPFSGLPLYGREQVKAYSRPEAEGGGDAPPLDPHVYGVARRAYSEMRALGRDQSILISGESGSGKTETTKYAMQFLALLARGGGIEYKVLQTNPILEAFGNAKSVRNSNSSRFGKLIGISFSPGAGRICGARVKTYLLEKSRVVRAAQSERNYHVFYQLCRGAASDEGLCKRLRLLREPAEYAYLSSGGCTEIPGMDDSAEFQRLSSAMEAVGIDAGAQAQVFEVLAGVLWLGNVDFRGLQEEPSSPGSDEARVSSDQAAQTALVHASELLGVTRDALRGALTTRLITAGRDTMTKPLTTPQAENARDSLSMALYSALFGLLVDRINACLDPDDDDSGKSTRISILDIYGFECFDSNSFEQLCINFANEQLQQLFTCHLFKQEQQEYEAENIDWRSIPFEDNQACLDLFQTAPYSFFPILEDELVVPRATDLTLNEKFRTLLKTNPHFCPGRYGPLQFGIRHYAGTVVYDTAGFLERNRDSLSADLEALIEGSGHCLLPGLAERLQQGRSGQGPGREGPSKRKGSRSVGMRFQKQLSGLIQRLESTSLNFIRCIKPNQKLEPGLMEDTFVMNQMRYCGVVAAVELTREGYPTRYSFKDFADRYAFLLNSERGADSAASDQYKTEQILEMFSVAPETYKFGSTKVFLKSGALGRLEASRAAMLRSVRCLQARWRGVSARGQFVRLRHLVITLQARTRGRAARRDFLEQQTRRRAATSIQRWARTAATRRRFLSVRKATRVLQRGLKRHLLVRRVSESAAKHREIRAGELAAEILREAAAAGPSAASPLCTPERGGCRDGKSLTEGLSQGAGRSPESWNEVDIEAEGNGEVTCGGRQTSAELDIASSPARLSNQPSESQDELQALREQNRQLKTALRHESVLRAEYGWRLRQAEKAHGEQLQSLLEAVMAARCLLTSETSLPEHHTESPLLQRRHQQKLSLEESLLTDLGQEYRTKQTMFEEDLQFAGEAMQGHVGGVDVEYELEDLYEKFHDWKNDFKGRVLGAKG